MKVTLQDFVHIGPGTLCGRWLRRFWHPVLLERELQPGQARPLKILGEDFTLYRGESGTFHAVAFRCAHRGTQLSTGWVEEDTIRCFYHGWQYDGGGQCIEQPDEKPGLASRIRIRSYPVQSYLGLVFVYFGEKEPPPLPRYRNFEDETDSVIETRTYAWPCSFFNSMENDSFHGNWVHRESYAAIGRLPQKGEQSLTVEETAYGIVSHITRNGTRRFRSTDRHVIIPNINYRRASNGDGGVAGRVWSEAINWRVPVDDTHFKTCIINKYHGSPAELSAYQEKRRQNRDRVRGEPSAVAVAEEILRGNARFVDFPGRLPGVSDPRLFGVGDYVSQVGQGPLAMLNEEHLGRTDVEVAMFRRIYRREMEALSEGRPLKAWAVPDWIEVRTSED